MKRLLLLSLGLLVFGLVGCDRNTYYTAERDVDETGWNMATALPFDVQIADTLQLYNFYIDVRNSAHYTKANLFLFINTTFPDGSTARDTLECPLADLEGHWYGRRTGRYVDSRYLFRRNVIFPQSGTYRFEVLHGMRDTNIAGIKSIGLKIMR